MSAAHTQRLSHYRKETYVIRIILKMQLNSTGHNLKVFSYLLLNVEYVVESLILIYNTGQFYSCI